MESQEALGAVATWLNHSQRAIPHCKSYSVLSWFVRALTLPEERVVLLPQGTRVSESCFLERIGVHVQSSRLIVKDCCLPEVLDGLQVCRKDSHHCPDVTIPKFQNWFLLMILFVVAWCHGCSLLFGWSLIPIHPMRMADRGGTAPYRLGLLSLGWAIAVQ